MNPNVAVVIPNYNRWPFVVDAVESCLDQSYMPGEIIVVDDASTDGSVDKLEKRFGNRIRLLPLSDNREKSFARNAGIRQSDSEFVCMLDSDDLLTPDSLKDRMRVYLEEPEFDGVSYGAYRFEDKPGFAYPAEFPSGDILREYVDNFTLLNNNAYLLRRSVMLEEGMYRENLVHMEDRELMYRLMAARPFRFCGTVVQTVRRVDRASETRYLSLVKQGRAFSTAIRANEKLAGKIRDGMREILFSESWELARAYYKAGKYAEYVEEMEAALREYPDKLREDFQFRRRMFAAKLMGWFQRRPGRP